ncbi:MAG: hypothetical protein ACKVOH_02585, partial [Chlamydiales bacterium]
AEEVVKRVGTKLAYPNLVARKIRKTLMNNDLKSPSISEIEQEICKQAALPLPIYMGDENYDGDADPEKHYHQSLYLVYHVVSKTLTLYSEDKWSREVSDNAAGIRELELIFM